MNSVGLTTGTTVTNALDQTTSTTLDPQRGLTLTATDANGVVTTRQYDALGRVTAVWLASRSTSNPANYAYSYQLSNTGVTAVTTRSSTKSRAEPPPHSSTTRCCEPGRPRPRPRRAGG